MHTIPWERSRRNGSVPRGKAAVAKIFMEEPGVDQVHARMLDAADVLVDRHPRPNFSPVERFPVVPRIDVPQEIPARLEERVEGVGFPTPLPPTGGTGYGGPFLGCR